jgi:putative tryptophan/tyrosine transport system substrate-binding protein
MKSFAVGTLMIARSVARCTHLIVFVMLSTLLSSPTFADNTKLPKIGELWFQDQAGASFYHKALRNALRELGYVDGKTATFVSRFAQGDATKLPGLLTDILSQNVDVIYLTPRALTLAQQKASATPMVSFFFDPIAEGIAKSLSRPIGNITGMSWQSTESSGKRMQYVMELIPDIKEVTLLYDPSDSGGALDAESTRNVAAGVGIKVNSVTFNNAAELETRLSQISRAKPRAMIVVHTPLTVHHREQIVRFATRANLPLVSEGPDWAAAGALLSYGPSIADIYKRTASYMSKILKGAKPGDLPIEQPTLFVLAVNKKTAKSIGIKIPESILLRADEVIQ